MKDYSVTNGVNGHEEVSGSTDDTMPIAVIGMSCRFPGDATDPERLWNMCREARDAWTTFPAERFNANGFYHPDHGRKGSMNVKGGYFLEQDLGRFDATFFNMTSAEVETMDPQQRILLETCYEAIENAGLTLEQVFGSETSVYVGSFGSDYSSLLNRDPEQYTMYASTGTGQSMLANRLSYFFNFTGPSLTTDTACSSSLVALHLACQSLVTGEAKQSIVGGSNIILSPTFMMIFMTMMRFLSPEGKCYSFDHRANGYGRGEGAACVMLKPLADAIRDGDTIRAVIRNTGCNSDGRTPGITLPSREAQASLIRKVYESAGLDPNETDFVEAHGTGTMAGDPIEAGAIASVFSVGRNAEHPVFLGSIKTNVGHTEGSSGLAGLIKSILMLENRLILPNCNFEKVNPQIPLEAWKIKIATEPEPWHSPSGVRRASVNSFGYGGTNVHVIVEEAFGYLESRKLEGKVRSTSSSISQATAVERGVPANGTETSETHRVYTVSAASENSAKLLAWKLCSYLAARRSMDVGELLRDLSFTLCEKRTVFPWKKAFSGNTIDKLIEALEDTTTRFTRSDETPIIGFVFTGQGAQWYAMGRELMKVYPIFRQALVLAEKCLKIMGAPWSLLDELAKDAESSRVGHSSLSQPLCTAIQVALVDLLASWGIRPGSVTGHSSGEIAAAYAAGVLSLESAMTVAYQRGVAVSSMRNKSPDRRGAMMAVGLSEKEATSRLHNLTKGIARVACINSPSSVTISGDEDAIDELQAALQDTSIFNRRLAVDIAYHSHHMEFAAENYRAAIADLPVGKPAPVDFYSSVTGQKMDLSTLSSEYWVSNLLGQVKFSDSLRAMCLGTGGRQKRKKRGLPTAVDMLIEIGPHSALAGPVRDTMKSDPLLSNSPIEYTSALVRNSNAVTTCQRLACRLFERGATVDFAAVNRPSSSSMPRLLVDLPTYAWNHSTSYWHEPRLSKEMRNRSQPRTDLLGVSVVDANSIEPRWKNIIRVEEIPWIKDHKVTGSIVFPAAGYVTMAIEAVHQRATEAGISIASYQLREIQVGQALIVPDPGEVEVMISLRPFNESMRTLSEVWEEFFIHALTGGTTWTQHCRGLIRVNKEAAANEVDGARQTELRKEENERLIRTAEAVCDTKVNMAQFYENLAKLGLDYGETFANMSEARHCSSSPCALADVTIADTASIMPMQFQFPHKLHPSTLDSCMHVIFPAIGVIKGGMKKPLVPTVIKELTVSSKIISEPGHKFSVWTNCKENDFRSCVAEYRVFNKDDPEFEPMITASGILCVDIEGDAAQEGSTISSKAFQFKWKPDVDLLPNGSEALFPFIPSLPEEIDDVRGLERSSFYWMERCINTVKPEEVADGHLKLFYASMQRLTRMVRENQFGFPTSHWADATDKERIEFCSRNSPRSWESEMINLFGESLPAIVRKEADGLELLMKDDGMSRYYTGPSMNRCFENAMPYFELLGYKNPNLNILEVGAGTGGASLMCLETLGGQDGSLPHFSNYDFTDISTGYFERSREKLKAWGSWMNYKKLDLESDPVEQGFAPESYDLIVASYVLHATSKLQQTLASLRKLLKPGGRLLLNELCHDKLRIFIIFGTLPGWWVGDGDGREESPLLTVPQWDVALKANGFSGVDQAFWETSSVLDRQASTLFSSATGPVPAYPTSVSILAPENDNANVAQPLKALLDGIGVMAETVELNADLSPSGKVFVVLYELTDSILSNPSAEQFDLVKKLLSESDGVLWVVRGASRNPTSPDRNLFVGLARTLRQEVGSSTLITVDFDGRDGLETTRAAELILEVFEASFNLNRTEEKVLEIEYAEENGILTIPRLVEDEEMNVFLDREAHDAAPEEQPFYQEDRALILQIGTPGLLDTLHFIDDVRAEQPLADDHVKVQIKATGLNFKDIMISMGEMEQQPLGLEITGLVLEVGKSIDHVKVGDRVVALSDGSFSNYGFAPGDFVQKLPDHIPFEIGATLPIGFSTAYYSAMDVARVLPRETVLIHAASGALGQALMNICKMAGAEIYATVGTTAKKELIMSLFDIPEHRIFSSRDNGFAKSVMSATENRGVDVVFNCLAGDLLRESWYCISPLGRFIELGKRDFFVNTRLEMYPFLRNVMFACVDLVTVCKQRPKLAGAIFKEVMRLLGEGIIKAVNPVTVFSMAEVEKAMRIMQSGKHMGKLVVMPGQDDIVKAIPSKQRTSLFKDEASYLLVGGLGGLGRAQAVWMMNHGAKNFVFASRSGAARPEAKDLISLLEGRGCKVFAPSCDISDADSVATMLSNCKAKMPPIRGVIHGGMIMRSSLFPNMTLDDWQQSLSPKVAGTWNLHNQLGSQLDFFILLSSQAGVLGNASQGAYSAASTFQDAFAEYRRSIGLPATTIDVGQVIDVGYVAENTDVRKHLEGLGYQGISGDQLMAMLHYAIRNPFRPSQPAQTITGPGAIDPNSGLPGTEYKPFSHFRKLAAMGIQGSSNDELNAATKVREILRELTSFDEAVQEICTAVIAKLGLLVMAPVEEISASKSMAHYGMDSLIAVEMRNWLTRELEVTMPILELLANQSLMQLAEKLAKRSRLVNFENGEMTENS